MKVLKVESQKKKGNWTITHLSNGYIHINNHVTNKSSVIIKKEFLK